MTSKLLENVEATADPNPFYALKLEIIEALKSLDANAEFLVVLEQQVTVFDFYRFRGEIIEALNKAGMGPKKGRNRDEKGLGV